MSGRPWFVEWARVVRPVGACGWSNGRSGRISATTAYSPGHDPELDLAVKLHPQMNALLQQDMRERATLGASVQRLRQTIAG